MKIININIIEFASIKNRSIDFVPGLNIIEGENESGKSSILSFIKFILYGLPRRASGDIISEKERSFSWDGGIAAGSMTVSTKLGDFRIERSARESIRGEKVSIIDLASGTPVHKGEVPGELFLGVPASIFESTAFVKQLGCGSIDGSELGNALQNLLLSADETLDSEKAISKLDGIRRKLLHKTKQGGSIYELSLKRDEYAARLSSAKEKALKIAEYEASYESLNRVFAESKAKLEENRKLCEAYDKKQQLIRFESLHSVKARIGAIEKDIETLKTEKCHLDFVPDSTYQRELLLASRDYTSSFEEYSEKKKAYERAEGDVPPQSDNIKLADKIEEVGGADEIAHRISKGEKNASRLKLFGILSLVLAILSTGLLAFALAAVVCNFLLLPPNLPGPLAFLEDPIMAAVFGAASAVLITLSVVLLVRSSKHRKASKALCLAFSLGAGLAETEMRLALEENIRARNMRNEKMAYAEKLSAECDILLDKTGKQRGILCALLEKIGISPEDHATPKVLSGIVSDALASSSELCKQMDELLHDLSKYKAVMAEREKEVADLDEAELRKSLSEEILNKLSGVNITMLRREHDFLRSKVEQSEQKKYFYDRELIGLRARAENPLKSEALLRKTERKLQKEIALHDALSLAANCIREAAEAMQRNVTPRLRARASEFMSFLTNGKYRELGITPEFRITVSTDGVTRQIEALSAGTKDAAYLSVRLALIAVLYRGETPPLLFDEVLSQIDNTRAAAILKMLSDYSGEESQCLLFSCHTREASMIKANVIKL